MCFLLKSPLGGGDSGSGEGGVKKKNPLVTANLGRVSEQMWAPILKWLEYLTTVFYFRVLLQVFLLIVFLEFFGFPSLQKYLDEDLMVVTSRYCKWNSRRVAKSHDNLAPWRKSRALLWSRQKVSSTYIFSLNLPFALTVSCIAAETPGDVVFNYTCSPGSWILVFLTRILEIQTKSILVEGKTNAVQISGVLNS